ncbi:MAG: Coenzyme F420 hydrogenase/dehydrogenase, beta subunit C-terminal domain [Pseudomonadota bacterium]
MSQPSSHALKRVLDADLCTGCGLCAAVTNGAITMDYSEKGFLRPRQVAAISPEQDDLILGVCPGLALDRSPGPAENHPVWGPYHAVRVGWSSRPDLRHMASSGGGLSAILTYLVESGRVDAVLQVAGSEDRPIDNAIVVSRSYDAILSAAGSRYSPSAPLADLTRHMESGQTFALVGKPCDVAALRRYARLVPEVDRVFPVLVSFFCAGIPSRRGTEKILQELEVSETDVAAFRYRGNGWPGRATAVTRDGTARSMSYEESWGDILSKHVQTRCKICPDGTGSFADVVCADAWDCDDKGYPIFDDQAGVSLVMTRTDKGEEIVGAAEAAGYLETGPFDLDTLPAVQPGQYRRSIVLLARLLAFPLRGRKPPRFKGFNQRANAFKAGIFVYLRNFLGMFRRL